MMQYLLGGILELNEGTELIGEDGGNKDELSMTEVPVQQCKCQCMECKNVVETLIYDVNRISV